MKLSLFDYHLLEKHIAHSPSEPRDAAKLLLLNKTNGEVLHRHFSDLPHILNKNDVLVFNNTKVFPARLYAGKIEILLLSEKKKNQWSAMHRGKVTIGDTLDFQDIHAHIINKNGYEITLQFIEDREIVLTYIEQKGQMPLPPYIHSNLPEEKIRENYQTVYAKINGSVAAPTAGLHFTKKLISKIKAAGIQIEYITLHVGAGTFLPIKTQDITKHTMHSEYYSVDPETLARLNEAKLAGKRIVSVGTTTTRVLETLANNDSILQSNKLHGSTNIFIYPPYSFKFVDALITNFHLPHSTLLALVSAFVSKPNTSIPFTSFSKSIAGKAYEEAIKNNYKFYSFGDGMMIG